MTIWTLADFSSRIHYKFSCTYTFLSIFIIYLICSTCRLSWFLICNTLICSFRIAIPIWTACTSLLSWVIMLASSTCNTLIISSIPIIKWFNTWYTFIGNFIIIWITDRTLTLHCLCIQYKFSAITFDLLHLTFICLWVINMIIWTRNASC